MSNKSTKNDSPPVTAAPVVMAVQSDAAIPKTVAGQRHISPVGRHSQQTRQRATARAEALGFTTVRELYDYDRAQVLVKLQKGADGVLAQQKNEQNRRSGVASEKP